MELILSKEAIQWFKDEMDATSGDFIKFFARYGGSNPFHEGFSIGVNFEEPIQLAVSTIIDDITFFVEEDDLWFFNDHDLHVTMDTETDELHYEYVQPHLD